MVDTATPSPDPHASDSAPLAGATVGCGRMGAFHSETVARHAPAFWMPISHLGAMAALPGIVPVACCDVSEEARTGAQALHGVPRAYASHEELLAAEAIDVLTVATRTPQKTDILTQALAAGVRAVHMEKPLCNTAAELAAVEAALAGAEAARGAPVPMTFGCLRRFLPPYRQARAHAQDPAFGPLVDIHIEMGNAPLMWALVHAVEQLIFFAGGAAPVEVQAWFADVEIDPAAPRTVVNDPRFLGAVVRFETGVTGRIGRTGGDAVTLSSASARVEVFGDGHQMFASAVPEGGVYQRRAEIPVEMPVEIPASSWGGTAAAVAQLVGALGGEAEALAETRAATAALLASQRLLFDMVTSHLAGGGPVAAGSFAPDTAILGLTGGRPA